MDPRGPSVALSLSSPEAHFGRRRSVSRSDSHSSTASIQQRGEAMAIPGARRPSDNAPPPLPPPRHIFELDKGQDLGWQYGNVDQIKPGSLRPFKEGSSLLGGFSRPSGPEYKRSMDLDTESAPERRPVIQTNKSRSPSNVEASTHHSSDPRRPTSPNTNAMLHGEGPLTDRNLNSSNMAYDKAVLSKIGKSNSPPRQFNDTSDSPVLAQKLSLQTKEAKMNPQQSTPNEKSATTADSTSRWPTSPASTGASPFSRQSWRDGASGPRSPPLENGASTMALDPELFVHRPVLQHTSGTAPSGAEDMRSRSARSSYDQAMYTPASESAEGMPEDPLSDTKMSKQGMKRKSPPCEGQLEDRPRPDHFPRLATRVVSRSPKGNYPLPHGSVSSVTSSIQQASYSSSTPLSAAQSSMTSMSSFDTQSPRDLLHNPSYITSAQPVASPVALIAPRKINEKIVPKQMSAQQSSETRLVPARIGNHYICGCCPKKPKKFETEEQLRTHENEKQYSCNFCSNRFKNKNEAERHQNSLHLRRHSWSCAALDNYQAAFSPTGAVDSNSAAMDACGYCGEEFSNQPAPNWDQRIDHLTNVHKFGECNSAKKFFRADHFRQHLKHSHAGRSGKWTNILEHACVRDEIPPEAAGYHMSTGEQPGAPVRTPSLLSMQVDIPAGPSVVRGIQDQ